MLLSKAAIEELFDTLLLTVVPPDPATGDTATTVPTDPEEGDETAMGARFMAA